MRENLKRARLDAGMTQQRVAERVGISLRHYCKIEAGDVVGSISVWDSLEDLFGVNQRSLRQTGQEDGRRKHRESPRG